MDNDIQELLKSNGEIAFAVIGFTQIIKMMGFLQKKYLPFVAILSGIGLTMGRDGLSFVSFFHGLIIGIVSTGLVNRLDGYIDASTVITGGSVESAEEEAARLQKALDSERAGSDVVEKM